MNKAIHGSYTAKEYARRARTIIESADWRLAPDAVSLSDIARATLTFQDDWKNIKEFVSEGRLPGNPFHVLTQGKMGRSSNGVPEVTVLYSGADPNDFLVTRRNPSIEQALRTSGLQFSVDRNFWDCGEEFLVLRGDAKRHVESLVAGMRLRD